MKHNIFLFITRLTTKQKLLIVVTVYVLVNIVANIVNVKLDFSKGKAYTLSPATQKIITNLDKTATITLYMSSDLPVGLVPLKTDVMDLVGEYRRAGRQKIRIVIKNPSTDAKLAKEANEAGIPEIQVSQIERKKTAETRLFFGMSLTYKDKKETIPQVVNLSSLEYDITSALYKMSREKAPSIGFWRQVSQADDPNDFLSFQTLVERQFSLQPVNLATSEAQIDPVLHTIVIVAENEKIGTKGLAELKRFVEQGGSLVVMADGISVSNNLTAQPATHDLFSFLSDVGIVINHDLILSETAEVANFSDGRFTFFTPYPFWLKTASFERKRSEFANVGTILFPWVSSLSVTSKGNSTILVKTQKNSWKQAEKFTLIPNKIPSPQKKDQTVFNLVAEVKVGQGRVMVIPTSRFIKQQFINERAENIEFILNVLNNYASGGALSGIRARAITLAPLEGVSERTKEFIIYMNIIFLPGLFAFFGTRRLTKR